MKQHGRNGLAAVAAALVLCLAGSIPTPTVAQSVPHTVSCSRTLTGQEAWLGSSSVHTCGAVQVQTRYTGQKQCTPYPGGQFCVTIYFFEMQARRVPAGGSVLVAKVDVWNGSPVTSCSFSPGNSWSEWQRCSGANGLFPPARMTLSSVVLVY
jgi:hypothetical protein